MLNRMRAAYRERSVTFKEAVKDSYGGVYLYELRPWRAAVAGLPAMKPQEGGPAKLVFVTGDPFSVDGSRGDQAMMRGTVDELKAHLGAVDVAVITAFPEADERARALGYTPLRAWTQPFSYEKVFQALADFGTTHVAVIGADVLDGYYSATTAARMVLIAEGAHRMGAKVTTLGFSFNEQPSAAMKLIFEEAKLGVPLNARDTVSADRLATFCGRQPNLVADVAFLMRPSEQSEATREAESWIVARRAEGRRVFGANVHPHLIKNPKPGDLQALAGSMAAAIKTTYAEAPASWILLPHDIRPASRDGACLDIMAEILRPVLGQDLFYPQIDLAAPELKRLVSLTDGVVTGRMHLAIATLGSGVPVMAVTYQGKFPGLFQHFGLGPELMLTPAEAADPSVMTGRMREFLGQVDAIRPQVVEKLPHVTELSRRTLQPLL